MSLKIDYSNRDIDSIIAEIRDLISKITDKWTNQLDSDIGTALTKTFAAITDLNSFYLDRQAAEVYLESCELQESAVEISKHLGYTPIESTSAVSKVVFELGLSYNKDIIINSGTRMFINNLPYLTRDAAIIPTGYETIEVPIIQGTLYSQSFISNGSSWFKLSVPDNITNLEVTVDGEVWNRVSSFIFVDDPNSYRAYSDIYNRMSIEFESGIMAIVPPLGSEIIVTGILSDGDSGNLDKDFNIANVVDTIYDINGVSVDALITCYTIEAPHGAISKESLLSIKQNAPRFYTTQNRTVADYDYKAIALMTPGVVDAECWGGQEVGRYGEIFICIHGGTPEDVPESLLEEVKDRIVVRSVVPFLINVVAPKIIKLDISVGVYCNTYSQINSTQVKVVERANSFVNNLGIGKIFQYSDFVRELSNLSGVDYVDVVIGQVYITSQMSAGRVTQYIIDYPETDSLVIYKGSEQIWTEADGNYSHIGRQLIVDIEELRNEDSEVTIVMSSQHTDVYVGRDQYLILNNLSITNHVTGSPKVIT